MPMNPSKPTLHLGYCYIEYTDMKSADDAVSTMNLFELMGYFLRVGKCVTPPLADPLTNSAEVVDEVSKMAQMISKKLNSSKEFSDVRNRQKMNIEVIDSPVAELSNTDQKTESESKLKKRQHRSSDHDQQPGHSSLSPQKSPITSQHSPKRPKSQVDNSSPAVKSKYNENKILQDADPMSRSTLRCHESAKNIEKTVENQLDFISDFDVSSNSTAFPADSKSHVEKLTNGRADSGASNNTPEKKHDPSIKKEEHLKNSTTKDVTAIASSTANLSVEENGNLLRGAEAKELHMHKLMRVKEQRVVVLSNMVGVDDVDEALEEEIKNECSKYASVLRVIIYIQDEYGSDEVKTVHIFIECESEEGAQKLKDIMNGRYFAQRMIAARFYDQELYDESHFQV
ncbi:MAG: Poly(U)-binding-splicing factor puf60 [Marteilia pararefringens]